MKCIEGSCQNQAALKIFHDLVTLHRDFLCSLMLTRDEKFELLRLARQAITLAFLQRREGGSSGMRGRTPNRQAPPPQWKGRLADPSGAFVTIRLHGELRGCIGYIEAAIPLGEVVQEVASKAAFQDPRFPPLTEEEFREASLEISILSPLRKVESPEEVIVGTHGAVVESGHMRGLLLPQVPVEYGWDRETFLDNLARKAGLPRTAWKDPHAQIFVFTAEVVDDESTFAEG